MAKSLVKTLPPVRLTALLFHLTLGIFILYPLVLQSLSASLNLSDLGLSAQADLLYSAFITLTSMLLAEPLLRASWAMFKKDSLGNLALSVKTFLWMVGLSLLVNILVANFAGSGQSQNQNTIINLFRLYPNLILFQALIYAPIVEELLFRGLLMTLLGARSPRVGLWLSSAIFGLTHVMSALALGQLQDLWFLPTYTLLGYMLGRAYLQSKSLHVSILAHLLNNILGLWAIAQLL
jgi:membrane protease YdiL (CAAX protease family)